jgi:hypothetical protein
MESVEFPKYFDTKVRLTVTSSEHYKLEPALIEAGTFKVAALRHPAVKGESGKEITLAFI